MTEPHVRPRSVIEEEVRVEHGTFSLVDPDGDYWRSEPEFAGDPIVTTDLHRVWLYSAGNDHYATVRVELWDSQPPRVEGAEVWHASVVELAGARLCLATTVGGPVVRLPSQDDPGGSPRVQYLDGLAPRRFNIEVAVSGREAAAELEEATWSRGVESWRIRLWPAGD